MYVSRSILLKGSVSHNHGVWRDIINGIFIRSVGVKHREPILKTMDIFPEVKVLEDDFERVRNEVMFLVNSRALVRYEEIDAARAKEVSLDWRLFYIKMLGELNDEAKGLCPIIINHLSSIKRVYNVTIAVLEPKVGLAAHRGPYAGILRYHLGIKVPKANPPHIRVDKQIHVWQEGQSIVIDDVFEHEVINNSEDLRVILIVDFLRPMNPFLNLVNRGLLAMKKNWAGHLIGKANRT